MVSGCRRRHERPLRNMKTFRLSPVFPGFPPVFPGFPDRHRKGPSLNFPGLEFNSYLCHSAGMAKRPRQPMQSEMESEQRRTSCVQIRRNLSSLQ
jgi:hypothetical protein